MKKAYKYTFGFLALLTLIIACTKEVGLYTEVEFEISETHVVDGFINTPLATSITVTPEELVEGYSYTYSYKISTGEGYFQDESGNTIAEGDKIGLNPLSASLNYIPTKIGDHSITFTAEDTFGFQEQVTVSYVISDVPVTWTATGPSGQVLLGTSQDITVTLGSETTTTGVTYERNYSFSQGTGTITSSPSGASETLNEFISITPGTYALTYVATELVQTTLEFLLKDSNGQEIVQTISFEVVNELSTEKEITSFIVNGVEGTKVGTDITIELPEGTDLTTLSPIIIHNGASISPESETSQDFTNPVIYTVTAQDQTIQTYTVNVTVPSANHAPTAIATSDVTSGAPSLDVQFTGDTSMDPDTGEVLTYAWDFGDGSTATTANPSHSFTTAGTYTVTLTVTDDGTPALNSTDTITIIVTDANQAPTAVATSDITSGEASLAVQFTGDTSSDPDTADVLTYAWDFGDGTTATTANPSHTFTTAATYDVTLTVTDDGTPALSSTEVTITITVNAPANQAPTAIATSDITSGEASLDVQFTGDTSSDPDAGDVLTYAWDFGDGSTATSANPAHTFTTAGTYDVTLTVTDDGIPALSSSEVTLTITVTAPANQAPTAIATSDITSGEASLDVQFTGDTSSDPDAGDVLTYAWDFGDGSTATSANPAHTFTTAGTYDVTLTVTDDGIPALSSSEVTLTITVTAPANQAPTAIATSDITSGEASLDVQFTGDTSSDPDAGDVLTYAWDFGDGTTATTANPSHTFTTAGTYDVTLTVTDDRIPALSSSEVTITITVNAPANQAPTAIASSDVITGEASLAVQFTGDTSTDPDDGDVLTYAWDFRDGSTATTANPSHTFTTAGTYDVTLTVTDDGTPALSSSEVTITVTVTAPVNQAPTAVATSDISSGLIDLDVQFSGSTSSDPDAGDTLTYAWDFGDGTTATTANPSHTFTTAGTYMVTLTVSDDGTPILNDTDTITITVGKPNISAFVDAGEDILVGPFDYQFRLEGNFSGLTTIASILWEEISTGSSTILSPNSFNTNVTITSGGTYIYKLTVINNLGGVGSDIIEVTVVQCPDSCSTGESKCYDPVTKICSCINNSGPVTVLCEAEGN
ncbi:PKD domain-containing protein [Cellulophaga sp. HaHa_2_1]|uniref:PKD domain-containing protein n=1 Tax=Cellulophaga sp. HaHa_2_1 TaxID=2749994 RepID=UPI001C4E4B63|nr:PKD domain-containing protein [Cellulophaga sp. HaHa_2_1]QXP52980.1 PKD domain-containing protein [Cellulophaga sp. HaHa_2_1]